jgi:hypothetical protein
VQHLLRAGGLARALALGLSLVVAASALFGGRAYVWCAPMAEARDHCCCPHGHDTHDAWRVDCCDDRQTPSLPSVERGATATADIPPAALVLVLALELAFLDPGPDGDERAYALRAARAGPRERVHALHSVYLI